MTSLVHLHESLCKQHSSLHYRYDNSYCLYMLYDDLLNACDYCEFSASPSSSFSLPPPLTLCISLFIV